MHNIALDIDSRPSVSLQTFGISSAMLSPSSPSFPFFEISVFSLRNLLQPPKAKNHMNIKCFLSTSMWTLERIEKARGMEWRRRSDTKDGVNTADAWVK